MTAMSAMAGVMEIHNQQWFMKSRFGDSAVTVLCQLCQVEPKGVPMATINAVDLAKRFSPRVSDTEKWNAVEATRLMFAADGVVEQCGCVGLDPAIQITATECIRAFERKDVAAVRSACQRIDSRARDLSVAAYRAA